MIKLLKGAAAAALTLGLFSTPAQADIVILRDGKILPSKVKDDFDPKDYPSNAVLKKSGSGNIDLRFDKVKIGGTTVDAAEVQDVYCTKASRNANFNDGVNQAYSRFFDAGLPAFRAAAEELKDGDKQVALWNAVLCASNLRPEDAVSQTKAAIDELLTAFPEGYYMPKAQILLCRVLLNQGKAKDALAALNAVTSANGMNARDHFDAAVNKINFFKLPLARKPQQLANVEKQFRALLGEIKSRRAETAAAVPMLQAMNGIGKCLVGQKKAADAKKFFDDVVSNKHSLADKSLLADAHRGLGDVIYLQVAQQIASGAAKEAKDEVLEKLVEVTLRYLRVIHQYRENARDSLQPAMQSVAQVWQWQFELEGGEDLALANRAVGMYIDAHKMLGRGPAKQELFRHVKAFIAKRNDLRDRLKPKKQDD